MRAYFNRRLGMGENKDKGEEGHKGNMYGSKVEAMPVYLGILVHSGRKIGSKEDSFLRFHLRIEWTGDKLCRDLNNSCFTYKSHWMWLTVLRRSQSRGPTF